MNISDLNAEIARSGLSIPSLAQKIGISKKTLYSRMREETVFTQKEIASISQILNLTDAQIINIFFMGFVS